MFGAHEIESNDKENIQCTIENYFAGYLNAESQQLAKAFHETAQLFSAENQKLEITTMPQWHANLEERKSGGDIRKAQTEILGIDISSNTAVAKVALNFATVRFVDYLLLVQLHENWIVVSKAYSTKTLS